MSTAYHLSVADAPVSSLEKEHDLLTSNIKGRLASSTGVMCPALSGHFHGFLTSSYGEEGEMELFDFVRGTMFDVVVRELYGSDNIPEDKVGMEEGLVWNRREIWNGNGTLIHGVGMEQHMEWDHAVRCGIWEWNPVYIYIYAIPRTIFHTSWRNSLSMTWDLNMERNSQRYSCSKYIIIM